MFTNLIITGYSILLGAILVNILADYFNISTWYTFLQSIFKIGLSETIRQQKIIHLLWLFCIYPIILSLSYMLGNKFYNFLIQ
jgi:hypothetical protein